jgi:hypothetical protein
VNASDEIWIDVILSGVILIYVNVNGVILIWSDEILNDVILIRGIWSGEI